MILNSYLEICTPCKHKHSIYTGRQAKVRVCAVNTVHWWLISFKTLWEWFHRACAVFGQESMVLPPSLDHLYSQQSPLVLTGTAWPGPSPATIDPLLLYCLGLHLHCTSALSKILRMDTVSNYVYICIYMNLTHSFLIELILEAVWWWFHLKYLLTIITSSNFFTFHLAFHLVLHCQWHYSQFSHQSQSNKALT